MSREQEKFVYWLKKYGPFAVNPNDTPDYKNHEIWPHRAGPFYDAACIMTSYRQLGKASLVEVELLVRNSRCTSNPRLKPIPIEF